jgi:hypothetical protein
MTNIINITYHIHKKKNVLLIIIATYNIYIHIYIYIYMHKFLRAIMNRHIPTYNLLIGIHHKLMPVPRTGQRTKS